MCLQQRSLYVGIAQKQDGCSNQFISDYMALSSLGNKCQHIEVHRESKIRNVHFFNSILLISTVNKLSIQTKKNCMCCILIEKCMCRTNQPMATIFSGLILSATKYFCLVTQLIFHCHSCSQYASKHITVSYRNSGGGACLGDKNQFAVYRECCDVHAKTYEYVARVHAVVCSNPMHNEVHCRVIQYIIHRQFA